MNPPQPPSSQLKVWLLSLEFVAIAIYYIRTHPANFIKLAFGTAGSGVCTPQDCPCSPTYLFCAAMYAVLLALWWIVFVESLHLPLSFATWNALWVLWGAYWIHLSDVAPSFWLRMCFAANIILLSLVFTKLKCPSAWDLVARFVSTTAPTWVWGLLLKLVRGAGFGIKREIPDK